MADGVFNASLGRFVEWAGNEPTKFAVVLLQVAEAEADLIDHADLASLLAAGNTEATFTNYERVGESHTYQVTGIAVTDDNVNDKVDVDMDDITWAVAGGATNNNLLKLIVLYNSGGATPADTDLIPVAHHDFTVTTDGSDITAQVSAEGFARAGQCP